MKSEFKTGHENITWILIFEESWKATPISRVLEDKPIP